jgi:AhpD family alkylhydroperoxidase
MAGDDANDDAGGYRARVERSAAAGRKLARHDRELHRSYWKTHDLAMADGALDRKTKELIGLALVVTMQCDVCVSFHVRDCLAAGATREEIYDALNVAVMQGSGPAMVYAGYAVEALDEYLAEGSEKPDGTTPPATR